MSKTDVWYYKISVDEFDTLEIIYPVKAHINDVDFNTPEVTFRHSEKEIVQEFRDELKGLLTDLWNRRNIEELKPYFDRLLDEFSEEYPELFV